MIVLKPLNVFILGNFNFTSNELSGQTTKTREIHRLFETKTKTSIPYYDIDTFKKRKLSIFNLVFYLFTAQNLIYLPASNNLRWLFPFLYLISKVLRFRIHYFVIGGWLPGFIQKHKIHRNELSKIEGIYVETDAMFAQLTNNFRFGNVIWFPNFRIDYQVAKSIEVSELLRIVYISRITKEKGVDTIFSFLDLISNLPIYTRISVDFYGPVHPDFASWFHSQVLKHRNCCYKGIVEPDQVQKTISNYDILLFPTRYPGEGCPGVIIDAYMASVPVVASDWKYNNEFVTDGVTGYLFAPNDTIRIQEIITSLINNRAIVFELGKNAKKFSERFTESDAWVIINQSMNLG